MKLKFMIRSTLVLTLMLAGWQAAWAQFTASGTVADARGEGLIGATVIVVGTERGATTDIEGKFKVQVPSNSARLTIAYTGFKTQTVDISSSSPTLTITLEEDFSSLEEVVVSGLATTVKRSNLANAVSSVSAQELVGTTV